MSFGAQQSAKKAVASQMYRRGFAFADIPHYTGIGIGEGANWTDSGFEGLPVELELGGLYPLQSGGGGRCPGRGVQGGSFVQSTETCMGVFYGVRNK